MSEYAMPGIEPRERKAYLVALAEMLERLHAVDWAAAGLADYGRPGDFLQRQIKRWTTQWVASKLTENAATSTTSSTGCRRISRRGTAIEATRSDRGPGNLGSLASASRLRQKRKYSSMASGGRTDPLGGPRGPVRARTESPDLSAKPATLCPRGKLVCASLGVSAAGFLGRG